MPSEFVYILLIFFMEMNMCIFDMNVVNGR